MITSKELVVLSVPLSGLHMNGNSIRHGPKRKHIFCTQHGYNISLVPTETPPPAYHSLSEVGSPVPSEHSLMDQLSPGVMCEGV